LIPAKRPVTTMRISAKMASKVEAGDRPARTPRETRRRGVVKSQSTYPTHQPRSPLLKDVRPTCDVNLSEEMKVLGVGTGDLGWDPTDTESSSHGKVRDHGDSEDHCGEPGRQLEYAVSANETTYQWKTLAFLWTLAERTKTPITPRVNKVKTTQRAVCPAWVEWRNRASGWG